MQLNLVLGGVAGGGGGGGGPANVTIGLHRLAANWGEGTAQQQTSANRRPRRTGTRRRGRGRRHHVELEFSRFVALGDARRRLHGDGERLGADRRAWSAERSRGLQPQNSSATCRIGSTIRAAISAGCSSTTDEATANTGRTFFSSEVATAAFRPQLEITYEVIPEPSTLLLGVTAGLVSLGRAQPPRSSRVVAVRPPSEIAAQPGASVGRDRTSVRALRLVRSAARLARRSRAAERFTLSSLC